MLFLCKPHATLSINDLSISLWEVKSYLGVHVVGVEKVVKLVVEFCVVDFSEVIHVVLFEGNSIMMALLSWLIIG